MVEKLSFEQEQLIPIIRDEWTKIALDTSPTDKQKAEAAIYLTYKYYEYRKPEIIWLDNPLKAVIWIASNRKYLGEYFQSNYTPDIVSNYIPENIFNHTINSSVNPAVKKLVYEKIFYQVRFSLENFCEILEESINDSFPYHCYDIDDEE